MQVLTWSAFAADDFSGVPVLPQTVTATLDPDTLTASLATVTNTEHDMFCPGISMQGNGNIVVSGGTISEKTSIYNIGTDTWEPGPPVNIRRAYQASVTISTGEVCKTVT
jgi:galactose oxidase